ncbi:MAG TPA: sigma-54 dependent transcriptional regulator, partial [Gemmatimonadales bacterium]|nr:sigma-54 dependent transcriptional regulator [Gemmatimonadales bacterium]
RGEEARDLLKRNRFDIVLLDLYLPEISGMRVLQTCMDTHPETIVIMITGNPTVDSSLEALRAGAYDYLPKPFSATHLQILLGRAAHAVIVGRESHALQAKFARENGNSDLITVLGTSPAFRQTMELARRVAATNASAFITGESGCGKELIAQFIHHHSRRSSRPLVAVNCAALPEALLESEMFGHVRGAFTGAVRDKPGLLEAANGGTLLLDELAEMPKSIQAKLLRVIQDGVVRRVGSETTDAVVNVRFIAATNRNPVEAVASGHLREDLYYRLRVVPIHVPPLRERPGDIRLLAEHFLSHYWSRHRDTGTAIPKFGDASIRALRARPWKGNVRELQNVIEHMVVLLEPGSEVTPEDIPSLGEQLTAEGPAWTPGEVSIDEPYYAARDRLVAEFELRYLTQLVTHTGGNMSRAARTAAVDRTTLYRLMERHGLHRKLVKPTEDEPGGM